MDFIEQQAEYEKIMRMVWDNPLNQQKPQILKWLKTYCSLFQDRILDIGTGNGYYLSSLNVKSLIAIEPNTLLQKGLKIKCKEENIKLYMFNSFKEYISWNKKMPFSYILSIHTFLYLREWEIDFFLTIPRHNDLIIITPHSEQSVTFLFEKSIGIDESVKKMDKLKLLGQNLKIMESAPSHFVIDRKLPKSDIARLVCNHLLYYNTYNDILAKAEKFVEININSWQIKEEYLFIPQFQELRIYSP